MGRFVLFYFALVVFVDAIIFALFVRWYMGALSLISFALLFAVRRLTPREADFSNVTGLALGRGVNIENPDQPRVQPIVLETKALGLGFLGMGSPGSGKSIAGIVITGFYTLQLKIGWVYWDGKGDKDVYQTNVAVSGRPDKFFSSELKHSDTTNVVLGPAPSVIEALTQTLINSESDYYRNVQRDALGMIVYLLKACKTPFNLRDIYVALKVDQAGHYAIERAIKAGADPSVVEIARQFYDVDPLERANDIKGLLTNLSLFVTGDIAERLNAYEPTLDLAEAAEKGERVFMHLPYSMMARDISILFTEQIGVIAKNRQLYDDVRTPWPQTYDDWGKFFYSNVGPITARCRSAGLPVSYLFQSKGQTDAVDNTRIFTTEIMDNIGGFFMFRINGMDTAEWAARQFGMYETTELSTTDNTSYTGQSRNTRELPRVRPDAIKGLNAGECFISTLVSGEGGASKNERFRARFPFPEFTQNPDDIDWPTIAVPKHNDECEGLHLWRDFMNRDRLQDLKKEVVVAAQEKQKQALAEKEKAKEMAEANDVGVPL